MNKSDKDRLIVKIDAINGSISDPLIQSVLSLIRETVEAIGQTPDQELGFKSNK